MNQRKLPKMRKSKLYRSFIIFVFTLCISCLSGLFINKTPEVNAASPETDSVSATGIGISSPFDLCDVSALFTDGEENVLNNTGEDDIDKIIDKTEDKENKSKDKENQKVKKHDKSNKFALSKEMAESNEEEDSNISEETSPLKYKESDSKGDENNDNDMHPYYTVRTAGGSKTLNKEYQDYTYEMCEKYGIEEYYNVIITQMFCESGYNPNAVGSSSCYGLMQVGMINYARLNRTIGITNVRDPKQNIEAGVYMMSQLVEKYHDIQAALVCYHRGEGAAKSGIRSDMYSAHIMQLTSNLVEA